MTFIDKMQETFTGKTAEQRRNDALARNIASREIQKASFEERARQMQRVAIEKEKIRADAMIRKEKARYDKKPGTGFVNPLGGGYSLPFGGSSISIFGNKSSGGSYNPISGAWSSPTPVKGVVKVRRRKSRPRRKARRMVYVRKYV